MTLKNPAIEAMVDKHLDYADTLTEAIGEAIARQDLAAILDLGKNLVSTTRSVLITEAALRRESKPGKE